MGGLLGSDVAADDQLETSMTGSTAIRTSILFFIAFFLAGGLGPAANLAAGQEANEESRGKSKRNSGVRSVTIPVTISPRSQRGAPEIVTLDFNVAENGVAQTVLSVRGANNVPLSLAILIQDDVVSSIGNEIATLTDFIRRLPLGSRVLIGYLRAGSLQVRQKFTSDLERAAAALRVPVSSSSVSPYNPYVEIVDALKRFESLPTGRRAILVVSDGLDVSRGLDAASPAQSIDLQRAINEAQRRGVAVYSIYTPTAGGTSSNNLTLVGYAQGSLNRMSDETGGKSFFQGTSAPVSFDPFLRELSTLLSKQIALTYLSTHPEKGFHRISISASTSDDVEIRYPRGYTR